MDYNSNKSSNLTIDHNHNLMLSPEMKEGAIKIMKFLQMLVRVKKAYMRQLKKVIERSAFKIQYAYRVYRLK